MLIKEIDQKALKKDLDHNEIVSLSDKDHIQIEQKLDQIAEIIKRDCSEALPDILKTRPMYRGIWLGNKKSWFLKGKSHNNRTPKDSAAEIQKAFDETLLNAGFKALRSNSIFATGDIEQAEAYSTNLYGIFPINGFNMTWFKDMKDLTLSELDIGEGLIVVSSESEDAIEQSKEQIKQYVSDCAANLKEDHSYEPNIDKIIMAFLGIKRAIDNLSSMDIISEKVFEIHGIIENRCTPLVEERETYQILTFWGARIHESILALKKLIHYGIDSNEFWSLKPSNGNLAEAINSGNEIYINGQYYMVHDVILKRVLKLLQTS